MSATNGHVLNDRQKVGLVRDAISFAIKQKKELADDLDAYLWTEIAKATGFTVESLNKRLRHARNGFDADGEQPFKETDFFDGMSEAKEGTKGPPDGVDCYLSGTQLARGDFRLRWLVKLLIVAGQPLLIGGYYKVLKTAILVNLALSLGSGTCFLEHPAFSVPKKVRVLVVSCESGAATMQETAKRQCVAKGIRLEDTDTFWWFDSYQLANDADLARLRASIRYWKPVVVIFDPAYLMLLAGGAAKGLEAGNLFDIGPLLLKVTKTCLDEGATPAIAHHAKKTGAKMNEPLELMDLAFSGFAEFARQWLLLSRRKPYEAGTGHHELILNAGGSCGQGGRFDMTIEEGQLAEDFSGRRWEVTIEHPGNQKVNRQERAVTERGTRVIEAIDRLTEDGETWPVAEGEGKAVSLNEVKSEAGLNSDNMRQAVNALRREGHIERVTIVRPKGKNHKAEVEGLRRVRR